MVVLWVGGVRTIWSTPICKDVLHLFPDAQQAQVLISPDLKGDCKKTYETRLLRIVFRDVWNKINQGRSC